MNLGRYKYFLIFFLLFPLISVHSQDEKVKVGVYERQNVQGGYYNFGDPDKVNIEVNIWGYAKNPGKYLIPIGTTVLDLLSYSGGPETDANLDKVRLYRPKNDSLGITKDKVIYMNYNDLVWEEKVTEKANHINPVLEPGDMLIIPGSPRYFFRDNLTFVMSISSILLSAAILIVSITNK